MLSRIIVAIILHRDQFASVYNITFIGEQGIKWEKHNSKQSLLSLMF